MPSTSSLAVIAPCACKHGVALHGPRNFAEHTSALAPCWVCDCPEWTQAETTADRLLRKIVDGERVFVSPGGLVVIDPLYLDALAEDEADLLRELAR